MRLRRCCGTALWSLRFSARRRTFLESDVCYTYLEHVSGNRIVVLYSEIDYSSPFARVYQPPFLYFPASDINLRTWNSYSAPLFPQLTLTKKTTCLERFHFNIIFHRLPFDKHTYYLMS